MNLSNFRLFRELKKTAYLASRPVVRLLNTKLGMEWRFRLFPFRSRMVLREAMLHPNTVTGLELLGFARPRFEIEFASGLRYLIARGDDAYEQHAALHARISFLAFQAEGASAKPVEIDPRLTHGRKRKSARVRDASLDDPVSVQVRA